MTRLPASASRQAVTAPPKPLPMTMVSQSIRLPPSPGAPEIQTVAVPEFAEEEPAEPHQRRGALGGVGMLDLHGAEHPDERCDGEAQRAGADHRAGRVAARVELREQ